jgi:hypothetical protein
MDSLSKMFKKVHGTHVTTEGNEFPAHLTACSISDKDLYRKITWIALFEGLHTLHQPKFDTWPRGSSGQSSSVNLENVHDETQSTEQIELDLTV